MTTDQPPPPFPTNPDDTGPIPIAQTAPSPTLASKVTLAVIFTLVGGAATSGVWLLSRGQQEGAQTQLLQTIQTDVADMKKKMEGLVKETRVDRLEERIHKLEQFHIGNGRDDR